MDCCEAWHTVNEINATKWKYRHFQIWSVTWEKWTHIANGVIFGKWKTLPVFALKKKCHRKFFMSAKIIGKKPVSSSPPCVRLNLGLILIQHTLWVFMTNRSTSWKKKKKKDMYTAVCWLSQQGVQAGIPVKLLTDSQRYQHYDSLWSPSHSKSPALDINDDNALSPTVDIWLVPNLWEHTHHMIWQMKLTRVKFAKYV